MRISDWSSDVCSSDLIFLMRSTLRAIDPQRTRLLIVGDNDQLPSVGPGRVLGDMIDSGVIPTVRLTEVYRQKKGGGIGVAAREIINGKIRSEEHTSELQSLMRNSYAVFCLKKKKNNKEQANTEQQYEHS